MISLQDCYALKPEHEGMFIRFEGRGILSGTGHKPYKAEMWKLCELNRSNETYGKCLLVKAFRAKRRNVLPEGSWTQGCELYTKKEFDQMPEYL